MTALPAATFAADRHVTALPVCATEDATTPVAEVTSPWQAVLDEDGAVASHRMTLRQRGEDTTLRTGRRGFAVTVRSGLTLVGERSAEGTVLTMVDTERLCRRWQRVIDGLAYDAGSAVTEDGLIRLDIHDPQTRWYEGRLLVDAEQGSTEAMVDGECSTTCTPNDGDVGPAAFIPAGVARPVPPFNAGGWPKDTILPFAWRSGDVPPEWAREPIRAGADDASDTSQARSPRFVFRSGANDTMRYTSAFPDFCRFGIACASRNMPGSWAVWIRPHGSDFSWGTLRWCQRNGDDGCFDLRRVTIHELGHVAGLNHPSSAGLRSDYLRCWRAQMTPTGRSSASAIGSEGFLVMRSTTAERAHMHRATLTAACTQRNSTLQPSNMAPGLLGPATSMHVREASVRRPSERVAVTKTPHRVP